MRIELKIQSLIQFADMAGMSEKKKIATFERTIRAILHNMCLDAAAGFAFTNPLALDASIFAQLVLINTANTTK